MKNQQISLFLILCSTLLLVHTQNASPAGELKLGSSLPVQLIPAEPKSYSITIPKGGTTSEDLFIHAAPKIADPFQVPFLTITAEGGFEQQCFNADAQFAGICRVEGADLAAHPNLSVTLRCLVDCDLLVQAYLGAVVKLEVGASVDLVAREEAGLAELIHVEVPQEDYTLAVMAVILNPEESIYEGEEGVDLLVNIGGSQVDDPNEQNFQIKASSLNGGGKGVFIYRDKAKPGQLIKSLVKLKQGVSVRFSISPLRGNEFSISLGQSYFDYALKSDQKMYTLDLTSITPDETLELVFDIYSGYPEFQLSIDSSFTSLIDFPQHSSANSILLTPSIRKRVNLTNFLYIRVMTVITAEYYFYTQLVREDVSYLQPYLTYFDEVDVGTVSNYILFERYKFNQDSQKQVRNFSFKVEIAGGNGTFHFKRCPSLQVKPENGPNFGDCLLNTAQQLHSDSFYSQEIQNRNIVSGNLMTIYMVYDVTQCTTNKQADGYRHVLCAFHIMSLGQSLSPFSFSLLPERKYLANYLREGKLIKEYIPRDNYAYFALSLPDLDKIEEVNVFMTALSGDAALIVSATEKLPDFTSSAIKQSGAKCNIVLDKSELSKEIYISVYAFQFTEVNLGVIVHRSTDSGNVHEIPLIEGNLQNYVLNKTQPIANFIISVLEQAEIIVLLNEISGYVRMFVLDQNKNNVPCINVPADRLTCKFAPQKNNNYSVKVEKEESIGESKFSITYKSQSNDCFSSSLNHPLYVALPASSSTCYSFSLNRDIDIELTLSLTHIQVMEKQVTTTISINNKPYSAVLSPHTIITVKNMVQACPVGLKLEGFPSTCKISIGFTNKIGEDNHFSFILEEQDSDVALFDGVNERVRGVRAQSGQGRRFYYHTGSEKTIQIFFSTQSLKSHYFLAAKFVSNEEFLTRTLPGKNIYLPYVTAPQRREQKLDSSSNYFSALLGMTGLETLSISQKSIKQYCPQTDCYLILSVYREKYDNNIEVDEDFYELQVTQQETVLPLGESKVGTVDKGDLYSYLISPEDAIVEFKMMDQSRDACLEASAAVPNGTIVRKNQLALDLQVRKVDGIERVYVKGLEDGCAFEISYLANDAPYRIVRLSQPYELDLTSQQTSRFIYYHENPRTFRIATLTSAGTITVRILPIKSDFTLASLTQINLSQFPIVDSYGGEFAMAQSDPKFCSRCYYYILVTTESRFIGQVIFLRQYDPVPLSTNHVFKEHLIPLTVLGVQNYIYYSLASFNVTFNMISGKIDIGIIDPSGTMIVDQQITEKTIYEIKAIDYKEKQKVEYFSEFAKYRIRVSVIEEAEYYLEVYRSHNTERLFEGYPSKIPLQADSVQVVEFINSQSLEKPLNLMINIDEETKNQVFLTFSLRGEARNGNQLDNDKLLKGITKSDNTYIINLLNFDGRYFIDIRSNIKASATFLLVRNSLTHLSPKQNYLFNNDDATFQVYSNYKKILFEVFNCQGELTFIGSRDGYAMEDNYKGPSLLQLRRPNYGGHYVFAADLSFASYFVKIRNKQVGSPLEYLINYYYYEDINPYEVVDAANYDISVERAKQGVILTVNPPKLLDSAVNESIGVEISIQSVMYHAYVSSNRVDLNRNSRCMIQQGKYAQKLQQSSPIIVIEEDLLVELDGGSSALFATVEAQIKIKVKHPDQVIVDNSPTTLTFLYNTLEFTPGNITITKVIEQTYTYWFTDSLSLFIGWMILPFILASAALYYLLTYCMRRLMLHQKEMVEEVQIIPSNQTVPTQQKIAIVDSQPVPDTGTQMIKEHI